MGLLTISCKKATYLVSKKEENRLSWLEKIKLRGHLTICSLCRKFEQQTGFIGFIAKKIYTHEPLSPKVKKRIQQVMGNEQPLT